MTMRQFSIRMLIYWHLFWITFPLSLALSTVLIKKVFIPEGYIHTVNTPYYTDNRTMEVLKEFNKIGNGKSVMFEQHYINRPITITEKDDLEIIPKFLRDPNEKTVTIGLAEVRAFECKITLKTGMDYATFRTTLMHEYLHCMGFEHVENDRDDLMAPIDGNVKEENIKQYADEVSKRIWKNLKN